MKHMRFETNVTCNWCAGTVITADVQIDFETLDRICIKGDSLLSQLVASRIDNLQWSEPMPKCDQTLRIRRATLGNPLLPGNANTHNWWT